MTYEPVYELILDSGGTIRLSEADLRDPVRMRAAFYTAIGHEMPHYDAEDTATIAAVIRRLCAESGAAGTTA